MTGEWYEDLREEYRPDTVRVLLVGESPPDPASGDRRFFYSPELAGSDNLYRGVAEALYGEEPGFDVTAKTTVLRRFQSDGLWLIDLCTQPVNHLPPPARRAALRAAVPELVQRAAATAPTVGVVVCMAPLYKLLSTPLRRAGLRVLHDDPLPFPMNWLRARFVDGFRHAISL